MLLGLPMTTGSLSNSLNSSGGTFNSNSSLNSTPSADRYAALKDLDEQLRDAKPDVAPEPAGKFQLKKYFLGFETFCFYLHRNSSKSIQESIPVRTATIVSKLDHS